jgi:hypothetical protein
MAAPSADQEQQTMQRSKNVIPAVRHLTLLQLVVAVCSNWN